MRMLERRADWVLLGACTILSVILAKDLRFWRVWVCMMFRKIIRLPDA